MASKPYQERTDLEKVQSQWRKLSGLHTREEWSAAIVRAATAAEITTNFAIRSEFAAQSRFDAEFIDSLLRWANGLSGKLSHLLVPLTLNEKEKSKKIKTLCTMAHKINKMRNSIAHQGEFCNKQEAITIIEKTKEFITSLAQLYEPKFNLKHRHTQKPKPQKNKKFE